MWSIIVFDSPLWSVFIIWKLYLRGGKLELKRKASTPFYVIIQLSTPNSKQLVLEQDWSQQSGTQHMVHGGVGDRDTITVLYEPWSRIRSKSMALDQGTGHPNQNFWSFPFVHLIYIYFFINWSVHFTIFLYLRVNVTILGIVWSILQDNLISKFITLIIFIKPLLPCYQTYSQISHVEYRCFMVIP